MGKSQSIRFSTSSSIWTHRQHQRTRHHFLRRMVNKLRSKRRTKLHPTSRHRLLHRPQHRQRTNLVKRQILRPTTSKSLRPHSNLNRPSHPDLRRLVIQQSNKLSSRPQRHERNRQKEMIPS